MDAFLQLSLVVTGVTAVWLTQCSGSKYRRLAPWFGLASQPFWFVISYRSEDWGVFALALAYTLSWARGIWKILTKDPDVDPGIRERDQAIEAFADQVRRTKDREILLDTRLKAARSILRSHGLDVPSYLYDDPGNVKIPS